MRDGWNDRKRRRLLLGWASGVVGALAMGWACWWWLQAGRAAALRAWRAELDTLPAAEAFARLRQGAEAEDERFALVVEALGHPRREIAEAARQALASEFERWTTLGSAEASRKAANLAERLVDVSPGFNARGRQAAAQFALRVAGGPLDRRAVRPDRVLAHCETVLRAAGDDGRAASFPARAEPQAAVSPSPGGVASAPRSKAAQGRGGAIAEMAALPAEMWRGAKLAPAGAPEVFNIAETGEDNATRPAAEALGPSP